VPKHKTVCLLLSTVEEYEIIFKTVKDDSYSNIFQYALDAHKKQLEFLDWIRKSLKIIDESEEPRKQELREDLLGKLRNALV